MSNSLRTEKQLAVLSALVEGNSVRSTERMTSVHRDTILRLMVRVGNGCADLLNEKMVDLSCTRLEMDELWSYVGKKQRHVTKTDDVRRVRRSGLGVHVVRGNQLLEKLGIPGIADDELSVEDRLAKARGQVVEHHDALPGLPELPDDVRADVTGASRDKNCLAAHTFNEVT